MKCFLGSFFAVLLLLCGSAAVAQQSKIDSLENAILQTDDDTLKFDYYLSLGIIHKSSNHQKSADYAMRALELAKATNMEKDIAIASDLVAFASMFMGDFPKAFEMAHTSMEIAKKTGWKKQLASSHRLFATIHLTLNEYDQAREYFYKAIDYAKAAKDSSGIAACYTNLGTICSELTEYDQALDFFHQAESLCRQVRDTGTLRIALINIGNIYLKRNQLEKALEYYFKILPSYNEKDPNITDAFVHSSIGSVYRRQEDWDQALYYHNKTLRILEKIGHVGGIAGTYSNLAHIYIEIDDYESAAVELEKALELFIQMGDKQSIAGAYHNLGVAYRNLGKRDLARDYYQKCEEISKEMRDTLGLAVLYSSMGKIEEEVQNHTVAREYMLRSGDLFQQLNLPLNVGQQLFNLAIIDLLMGNDSLSYVNAQRSIDVYEEIFETVSGESSKQLSVREAFDSYDLAIQIGVRIGKEREAFRHSELAKSRLLLVWLAEAAVKGEALDPELEAERNEIYENIAAVNEQLKLDGEDKDQLQLNKQSLLSQMDVFRSKLREQVPKYADLNHPLPPSIEEVQQVLEESEALVEYFLGRDRGVAFILTKSAYEVVMLDSSTIINQAVQAFQQDYLQPSKLAITEKAHLQADADRSFYETASPLYELLFEPLEATGLLKGKELIIVPDGALHYLPFELLIRDKQIQAYHKYQYLIQEYRIRYWPSATTLVFQRQKGASPIAYTKSLLAIGNPIFEELDLPVEVDDSLQVAALRDVLIPLEFAGEEMQGIARLFEADQVDVFEQEAATEEQLKQLDLKPYRYIHFSTHAMVDATYPKLSSIALTQDKDLAEDGFVQMYEMFDLEMTADLVSLSACETGLGKLLTSEGMVGFSRSLMYAGAPSLILSLWAVADRSTSSLFQDYYRRLVRDKAKGKYDPLRQTQLRMIRKRRYANPYYWAPFIFIGEK